MQFFQRLRLVERVRFLTRGLYLRLLGRTYTALVRRLIQADCN